jgi:uncharacterized membrane protein YczE
MAGVTAEFVRDAAATAVVFGFFSSCWFGWAQEQPPRRWRTPLTIAAAVALLTAAGGAWLTWQHWSDGTTFDPGSGMAFGVVVAVEVLVAGLGSWLLVARRRADLVSAWIALVVGVHLYPLAPLLHYPLLYVVATVVIVVALSSPYVARSRGYAVSAVTGAATGAVLLVAALFSLVSAGS